MTPIEEAAVKAVIEQITSDAMDDGLRAAAQMLRMTAVLRPEMTLEQVADAIEDTIAKHSND